MYKSKIFTLIFLLLFNLQYVSAEIISERGEYVLSRDISEKSCFENAKQRALNNAATVLTGEKLKSETLKICEASFENKAQCELYQSSWSVIDSVTRKGSIKIIEEKKVDKKTSIMWGTYRSLINNAITGVSTGHEKVLELNGVGFRANIKGESLNLQIGFSHDVNFKIPKDIKISVEKQTTIKINGVDKDLVSKIAADITSLKPVEPYKAKGIKEKGTFVLRKEGKKK